VSGTSETRLPRGMPVLRGEPGQMPTRELNAERVSPIGTLAMESLDVHPHR
jgi:hypothetical protein